ncbi:MAG: 3-oxoacyl-[acyl-carrier-protein] reductase FabG [Eubacteriales bacterium SKADARSKE-1]|nr:3-oxoacyl-[acyl-carrier-protein] reductase FabG [Eubacteriales bacterium SKADARSKE-1]
MRKTVLITGASRGIGRETAKLFAENNYRVIINYLNSKIEAENLEKELKNAGCDAFAVCADVSEKKQVQKMMEEIKEFTNHIDVLVNNAGIAQQKMFCDTTEDDWDRLFNVNVKGMFNCCQAVLPGMIKRQSGKIVNLSSVWGVCGASCEVAYSASKAAVIGFTKALSKEVGACRINVNCVAPGVIDTDMNKNLSAEAMEELKESTSLGLTGTPRDVAEMILFLSSDKAKFIAGQVINLNGGWI